LLNSLLMISWLQLFSILAVFCFDVANKMFWTRDLFGKD
jgi:hypothetical protein